MSLDTTGRAKLSQGPPDQMAKLLGAQTLEPFGLGVDPLGKRLIPVDAYLAWRRGARERALLASTASPTWERSPFQLVATRRCGARRSVIAQVGRVYYVEVRHEERSVAGLAS